MNYLCILEINLLSVASSANIFSQSVGSLFLFVVSFAVQNLLSFVRYCLFSLLFLLPWETDLRKHCYDLCQRMFCLYSSFMVSCLMFKPLSHSEFILVYDVSVY